jgi:hypothetical protein
MEVAPTPLTPLTTLTALTAMPRHDMQRHRRPSHELQAPEATYVTPLASKAVKPSPRRLMWEPPAVNLALANNKIATNQCQATAA